MEAFVTIGTADDLQTGPSIPKPEVKTLELDETYGKFALEPLERGFATTLGNPLRRVLPPHKGPRSSGRVGGCRGAKICNFHFLRG